MTALVTIVVITMTTRDNIIIHIVALHRAANRRWSRLLLLLVGILHLPSRVEMGIV